MLNIQRHNYRFFINQLRRSSITTLKIHNTIIDFYQSTPACLKYSGSPFEWLSIRAQLRSSKSKKLSMSFLDTLFFSSSGSEWKCREESLALHSSFFSIGRVVSMSFSFGQSFYQVCRFHKDPHWLLKIDEEE